MRVFLSWSGEASHKVACVLKDWLPSVIQSIRPYVSSQDIDKGARWSTDIAKELHEATFGILCVTRANIDAPWINFEAGALSKIIDRGLVAPFLFDIKRSEVQGPLLQFQSTINEKEDVLKLMVSLNSAMPDGEKLEEAPLKKSFGVWWPELEKALGLIDASEDKPKASERTGKLAHSEAILEELLDLTRSQQRLLRTPEELFPKEYMTVLFRDSLRTNSQLEEAATMVRYMRHELHGNLERLKNPELDPEIREKVTEAMTAELEMMLNRLGHLLRDRLRPSENTNSVVTVRSRVKPPIF